MYGRRLVLEWATVEEGVDELRKRTADHFQSSSSTQKKSRKSVFDTSDITEGAGHDDNNEE